MLCAVQNESVERHVCCVQCRMRLRSDIIVYFNVNLNLLTKLINSAIAGD